MDPASRAKSALARPNHWLDRVGEVRPGESLIVDTGNVAAFEARVQYEVTMVKGFKNILLGGEGLLNTRLTGPGKLWLQTMTMPGFAKRIIPFLPTPPSNNSH